MNVNEEEVDVQLMSEENVIMKVKCLISGKQMKAQKEYVPSDYWIQLEVTAIVDDIEQTKVFRIKMITQDPNEFKNQMAEVMEMLDLNNYSNNLQQNFNVMKQYFKDLKSSIQVNGVSKENSQINFVLEWEGKTVLGEMIFLKNNQFSLLGGYQLRFYESNFKVETSIVRNFVFRRTKIESLKNLFTRKGLHNIFMELHEEIAKIFQDTYNEILYPVNKNFLSVYSTQPGFMNLYMSWKKHQLYNEYVDFKVGPSFNGQMYIDIELKKGKQQTHKKVFPQRYYQRDLVTDYFVFLLKNNKKHIAGIYF